jgi:adenylate kinase family enzyme
MKEAQPIELPDSIDKIMVFGLPGSGKSTFATKLAQSLNLPIYHLDRHFYVES